MPLNYKNGVLEQVIDEILQHDKDHPTHGTGCVCMDKHAGNIRRLMEEKGLNYINNPKSMRNFTTILTYILR